MNNLKLETNDGIVSSDLLSRVKCMTIDTDLNVLYVVNSDNQLISIDVNNKSVIIEPLISLYEMLTTIVVNSGPNAVIYASKWTHMKPFVWSLCLKSGVYS